MKKPMWFIYAAALLAGTTFFGHATPAMAAGEGGVPMERLERLEQRVNEMMERQENMMRQLGGQMERLAQAEQMRNATPRLQWAPAGAPLPAVQPPPAGRPAKSLHDILGLLVLIGIICNILLSIWIFTDIRKRGEGSGLFVAVALVAGIPAAIIYALTRIGDLKAQGTKSSA